jgi:hypothetical protein
MHPFSTKQAALNEALDAAAQAKHKAKEEQHTLQTALDDQKLALDTLSLAHTDQSKQHAHAELARQSAEQAKAASEVQHRADMLEMERARAEAADATTEEVLERHRAALLESEQVLEVSEFGVWSFGVLCSSLGIFSFYFLFLVIYV